MCENNSLRNGITRAPLILFMLLKMLIISFYVHNSGTLPQALTI